MEVRQEFPQHHRSIREWLAARQWPVTATFGYFDEEIYAWLRHFSPPAAT
jgi:hypothetical protein